MQHQRGGAATSSVVRLGRAPQAEHRLDGPLVLYDLRRVVERHVPALLGSFDRTPAATEVDRLNLQPGINRGSANTRAVVAVQRCLAIEQRRLGGTTAPCCR